MQIIFVFGVVLKAEKSNRYGIQCIFIAGSKLQGCHLRKIKTKCRCIFVVLLSARKLDTSVCFIIVYLGISRF